MSCPVPSIVRSRSPSCRAATSPSPSLSPVSSQAKAIPFLPFRRPYHGSWLTVGLRATAFTNAGARVTFGHAAGACHQEPRRIAPFSSSVTSQPGYSVRWPRSATVSCSRQQEASATFLAFVKVDPFLHFLAFSSSVTSAKPLLFLVPLYILESCHIYHRPYLPHDLSCLYRCLCRAFMPVYLSIYPFLSLVLWMYVLLRVIVMLVLLFGRLSSYGSCGLCVVLVTLDQAFKPVGGS